MSAATTFTLDSNCLYTNPLKKNSSRNPIDIPETSPLKNHSMVRPIDILSRTKYGPQTVSAKVMIPNVIAPPISPYKNKLSHETEKSKPYLFQLHFSRLTTKIAKPTTKMVTNRRKIRSNLKNGRIRKMSGVSNALANKILVTIKTTKTAFKIFFIPAYFLHKLWLQFHSLKGGL